VQKPHKQAPRSGLGFAEKITHSSHRRPGEKLGWLLKMPPIQNCSQVCEIRGSADEEWVTKKKVEITTTKNIETKVFRQLVLEDGRVLDEEVPTVTVDRTEDKQIFVTDHDEERDLNNDENAKAVKSTFHTDRGVHIGDKFRTVKTTKDVKENVTRTEAVQNIGNIRSREVKNALSDKKNIEKFIQKSDREHQVATSPKTVFHERKHHITTDKEDLQERNWISGGKLKKETILSEERIEYDSDDSACSSGSSESSRSSYYQLEPEEYKTKTEESFTEYFVNGQGKDKANMVKIGEGPHYKSESKEGNRLDGGSHWIKNKNNHLKQSSHKQLTQVRSLDNGTKQTDRYGFGSSGLSCSTNDLTRFRASEGNTVITKASSVSDIRPHGAQEKVYIAKVIQQEETPSVKMRKKKTNLNYYTHDEQLSSSGQPIRPPRTKEYTFRNCGISESQKQRFKPARPHSVDLSESRYFNDSVSTQNKANEHLSTSHELRRNYHSTQNLSGNHYQSRHDSNKHHGSTAEKSKSSKCSYQLLPHMSKGRNYHSTQNLSERSFHSNTIERPRSVNLSFEEPIKVKSNYKLVPSSEIIKSHKSHRHVKYVPEESTKHYHSTGNIYKSVKQEKRFHGSNLLKHEPQYLSAGNVSESRSVTERSHHKKERKSSGQLIFSSEKPKKTIGSEHSTKTSSCEIFSMPREETRIIPIEIYSSTAPMTPLGSPSTKYKTRVVVNGAA